MSRRRRMPTARSLAASLAVATSLLVAGCGAGSTGTGSGGTGASATGSGATGASAEHQLTVFAAASLSGVFAELGRDFEQAHPGTHVTFSFAGSQDLVTQLDQGAPADVLATADKRTMDRAAQKGLVSGTPRVVATNTLTIVTPPDNPAHVTGLADLARPGTQVVVCAPQVPCGAAAQRVTAAAHVVLHPVSEEQAVTDVLGKVVAGQADAGLVYATDAVRAGRRVRAVPLPADSGGATTYPMAVTADAARKDLADQFVDLVAGPTGQAVLHQAGFGRP